MSSWSYVLEWRLQGSACCFMLLWLGWYPSCQTKSSLLFPFLPQAKGVSPRVASCAFWSQESVILALLWPPQLVSHQVIHTASPVSGSESNTVISNRKMLRNCSPCGLDCLSNVRLQSIFFHKKQRLFLLCLWCIYQQYDVNARYCQFSLDFWFL